MRMQVHFMRANSLADVMPSAVAVPTQELQISRVSNALHVEPHTTARELPPVSFTISVDVVECKKAGVIQPTTRTLSTVVGDNFEANLSAMLSEIHSQARQVSLAPISRPFLTLGASPSILTRWTYAAMCTVSRVDLPLVFFMVVCRLMRLEVELLAAS